MVDLAALCRWVKRKWRSRLKSRRAPLLLSIAVLGAGTLLMAASPSSVDAAAPPTANHAETSSVQRVAVALGDGAMGQPSLDARPPRAVFGEQSTFDLSDRAVAAKRIVVAANVEPSTRSGALTDPRAAETDPGWITWLLASVGIVGFVAARRRLAD